MGKEVGGREFIIDRESPSSIIEMAQAMNDVNDADDDFGDFSTADKAVSNGNHEATGGGGDDDDFGDFASSTLENNQHIEGGKITSAEDQTPADNVDDDFGDFGSAPTSTTNLASSETDGAQTGAELPNEEPPKTNTSPSSSTCDYDTANEEEDDDFGAFDGPTQPAPTPAPTPAPIPSPAPAAPVVDETPTTEDFGDFGSAPDTSKPTTPSEDPIENKPTEETFGEFDGPTSAEGQVAATTTETSADDDDFGDFGDFDSAPAPTPAPAPAPAPGESDAVAPAPTTETPAEDDDDFGDFGGFDSSPTSGTTDVVSPSQGPAPAATTTTTTTTPAKEDDFGDFGDFDSAPASETTDAVTPALVQATATAAGTIVTPETPAEEDDFGDFGDFDSAPVSATTDAAPAPTPGPAAATTDTPAEDDDFGDFGDFGSAPAPGNTEVAAPSPAPATATTEKSGDDDFGDFGDFDSAPEGTGDKPSSEEASAPPQARPQQSAEASDPVLQKAATVFSKVFERFKLEDSSDGKSDASETIAVAKLTASMDSQYEGISGDKLVKDFRTILNEMQKVESPPVFIVAVGERYSANAHFSVPVDGESFGLGAGTQQLDNSGPQQQQVPLLQSQTQNSASASRPQSTSTMVQLPPQTNNASGRRQTDGEQLSEKAQRFLRQVPDLSFMLQSKLMLPSNVK